MQRSVPIDPKRGRDRPRGFGWIVLALVSGAALILVVVVDLWREVRAQNDRALVIERAAVEREARRMATALTGPEALATAPESARFRVLEGLVVPPRLGWIDPPAAFDPTTALDASIRDRLARAERAEGAAARELWSSLLEWPLLDDVGRAWLLARAAWFAHRVPDASWRDQLLDRFEVTEDAGSASSVTLLRAEIEGRLPTAELGSVLRLPPERADAVCGLLARRGIAVDELRAQLVAVQAAREVLRIVRRVEPQMVSADRPFVRVLGDGVVLFQPATGEGAWLERGDLEATLRELREERVGNIVVVGDPQASDLPLEAAPVLADFAWLVPREEVVGDGFVGFAVLTVALAMMFGAGTFLALRAVRREAQTNRLRAEFLTTVTHELKTPLAGIRLVSELLTDEHVTEPEARRAWLSRLTAESVRLSMLIENVLDLGRLERGERAHNPDVHDVVEVVHNVSELFRPLADRDEIQLHVELPEGSAVARVDRDALSQALFNLLDNARKYGVEGGRIDLSLERGPHALRILVRDHGVGVDPTERTLIFDRFRRGAAHAHGGVPGVGLGLHLARVIVRRHGGDLTCIDPPDGESGACFAVGLPRAAADANVEEA